ncbi:hypothetical protein PFICI_03437 [Pestalotiopsis fici W106-1]|uniref:Uncharacterized protein n=1 Tax=Pestalotiopsis fici (strain W106-1 / CGMCC3.15140) TaxID=1229662 RepID=W3XIZ6_PESFW|nr:uncharacterized protein PFICI_03437 [Pestalotiopsis fici W106-1]ETS85412.1 hypothetical protein PFICI_03437 [Pestalotiopsis fici W106-1]
MSTLASVPQGPAPEWQRWANNSKMLNRMIKDEARSIKRTVQRERNMSSDKVDRLMVTTQYLASLRQIDENGWQALDDLISFLSGHADKLWGKMESHSCSSEDDDEDSALIKLSGQCSEVSTMVHQARWQQMKAKKYDL